MKKYLLLIVSLILGFYLYQNLINKVAALECDEEYLKELKEEVIRLTNELNSYENEITDIKNIGTATASEILGGKTAYVKGKITTGSMTNLLGSTASKSAELTSTELKANINKNGYYDQENYVTISYEELVELIGLDASKIKKGVTILGVTGTY